MADRRVLGLRSLLFISVCLLVFLCRASFVSCNEFPDLDPSEIEALGLEDEPELADEEASDEVADADEEEFPSGPFDDDDDSYGSKVEDPDVVILSSANFSDFISSKHFVMVEFYAPWCGHCQALAPEYAKAATDLKTVGVPLAKVDATIDMELAQEYNVQGYPTMFFFVDGKPRPYSHHRTSDAIATWVKKKIGPAVAEVATTGDAETVIETANTVVVAFFDKLEGPEVEEFASAARQEDDVLFYHTKYPNVAEVFNIKQGTKAPAVVLLKDTSEKIVHFDGKFERAALSEFILANKLPLVSTFSRDTATAIFESPIKKQLLLFASTEQLEKIFPAYEESAKLFKGKIIFVHVDSSSEEVGKPIMAFFGVSGDQPAIVGFHVSEERPTKYFFEGQITVDEIKKFGADFVSGNLKEFYKSEPIPEKNDGDVKIVVGNNFDEIVLDESKDVLLEIYAPWCGHCQALEPIYEKLAKVLSTVDSLVIAKMDGTTNEHARGKADGYPTLLFYPAGNKSFDPITVDTDRTVKALYQFLKKNASIPFTISKTSTSERERIQSEAGESKPVEDSDNSGYQVKDEL